MLALYALTMSGCSPAIEAGLKDGPSRLTPAVKKASPALPTKTLASSPASLPDATGPASCPDIDKGTIEALAKPTALPEQGKPVDPKKWIGELEGQVAELKDHLASAVDSAACLRARTTPSAAQRAGLGR